MMAGWIQDFFLVGGKPIKNGINQLLKRTTKKKDVGLGNHVMRIAACFTSTPINHIVFSFFAEY